MSGKRITVTINGSTYSADVESRLLLPDFIRHTAGLTGTHVGCEHGVCGACSILMRMPDLGTADDADRWSGWESVRSCLMFARQADGYGLMTVEGLAASESELHPLQEAFLDACGLQCGFCTPGFLMTLIPFLRDHPQPTEAEIREAIGGNLCRCTGYVPIVKAVEQAASRLAKKGEPQNAD